MRTRIDIGAQQTDVRRGDEHRELALGADRTAQACLGHDPPTPYEIERAIDVIETELMRAGSAAPPDPTLQAGGAALLQVAEAAGVHTLSLDAVEQMFQRLASESLGHPMARRGLPAGNGFVAVLLILREFMHHGGFRTVEFDAA